MDPLHMIEVEGAWTQFAFPLAPTCRCMLMMKMRCGAKKATAPRFTFVNRLLWEIRMRLP